MKVSAIICEYNPFHCGHKYHIEKTREKGYSHIISVMSGNFVQRGEVSVTSKWNRTRLALQSGVDLVIELPTLYSMSCAEKFAFGAVSIIDALGVVESISFGSEVGDVHDMLNLSLFLKNESPEFRKKIKVYLKNGVTYSNAYESVIKESLGEEYSRLVKTPNNILAIEYLKSILKIGSKIKPVIIKRAFSDHDSDIAGYNISSASYIRKKFLIGDVNEGLRFIPKNLHEEILKEFNYGLGFGKMSFGERAVIAKLRGLSCDELRLVSDVCEGIENRILDASRKFVTLEEIYSYVKSKRYTHARIRRIVLSSFLGIQKDFMNLKIPYVNVLGFNQRGREILKELKKTSYLPVVTRKSDVNRLGDDAKYYFNLQNRFDSLYSVFTKNLVPFNIKSAIYF